MFKDPFSFTGRIRRLEYGLSYIIFMVFYILSVSLAGELEDGGIIIIFLTVVSHWFILAQGTKRCHDLGHNGFFQFIPFYGIWMIFGEGTSGTNGYGNDPKEINSNKQKKIPFRLRVNLPEGKTRLSILNELISVVLLNVLLLVISYHYFQYQRNLLYLFSFLITTICFFLFLLLTNKGYALPYLKSYLFRLRLSYAFILFICLRFYGLTFLYSQFEITSVVYELFYVGLILGVTYLPFLLYPVFIKTQLIDD